MRRKWWDGSDVTIVALKLQFGDKFALSLAKIHTYRFPLHTSRLSLHGEVTRDGSDVTIVALKLAINLHFPLPKLRTLSFPPSHFPSLPSRRGHLYETSKNSIKLIPKTIGNRKRDCAWGCAGVKKLKKNQLLSTNHHQAKQIWAWWFVVNNWFFFNFLTPAHPHAQSLFLFPIVFGINYYIRFSSFFSIYLFIYFQIKRLNFWEVSLSSEWSKVFFSLKKTVWWTWNSEKDTAAKTHQESVTSYLKWPLFLQSTLFSCRTSRRLKSFSPIYIALFNSLPSSVVSCSSKSGLHAL